MSATAVTAGPRPALALDGRVAYSFAEVGRMLGKSPRTIKRLYLAGLMPAKPLGVTLMVPAAWVVAYGTWPPAESEVA